MSNIQKMITLFFILSGMTYGAVELADHGPHGLSRFVMLYIGCAWGHFITKWASQ